MQRKHNLLHLYIVGLGFSTKKGYPYVAERMPFFIFLPSSKFFFTYYSWSRLKNRWSIFYNCKILFTLF